LFALDLFACFLFIGARGYGGTTWEHKRLNQGSLLEEQLNDLGAQGWESAGLTYDGSNTT